MDEQEHRASPESSESPESHATGVTSPIAAPAAQQAKRHRRGDTVRQALVGRAAGWVVAAALAVAVVVLSVSLATAPTATGVRPLGTAGPVCLGPAGVERARLVVPGVRVQVPSRLLLPGLPVQVPPHGLVPAGLRVRSCAT